MNVGFHAPGSLICFPHLKKVFNAISESEPPFSCRGANVDGAMEFTGTIIHHA